MGSPKGFFDGCIGVNIIQAPPPPFLGGGGGGLPPLGVQSPLCHSDSYVGPYQVALADNVTYELVFLH